jgi:hypothetical protein
METATLAAEDFRPGFRYWNVYPDARDRWTIRSVEIVQAPYSVYRDGREVTPTLVIHTRRDGERRTFELGEMVAIQGPWHTDTEDAA